MIIIIGGTGQAKICYDIINQNTLDKVIAIFDKTPKIKNPIYGIPIYNTTLLKQKLKILEKQYYGPKLFVVAIGNPWGNERLKIHEKMKDLNWNPLSIQHETAFVDSNVSLGEGCQICCGASIICHSKIGNQCIINTKASIDHDCQIEDGCEIGPGATLCGNIKLEKNVWIGANATILPNITIGKNSIVGAGSVLTKNLSANTIVVGNPARKIADRTSEWELDYKNRKIEWI